MPKLIINWNNGTREEFKVKEASIEKLLKKRNIPNILSVTYGGKNVDLGLYQDIYGKPRTILDKIETVASIQARYASKKKKEITNGPTV